MVLVHDRTLRDKSWIVEFKKHDKYGLKDRLELHTYQLAYKFKSKFKDLSNYIVICDEVDFAANTDEYSKFFTDYPEVPIIGLTGYVTPKKKEWFDDNLPIIMEYSIAQAISDGVLNPMHFIFVKYRLGTDKNVKVEYKKNGEMKYFMTSENAHYDYLESEFMKAAITRSKAESEYQFSCTAANSEGDPVLAKAFKSAQYKVNSIAGKRRKLLYSLDSSKEVIDLLLRKMGPNDKAIVFSARNEQSNKLCTFTYNNSNSKDVNERNYNDFINGTINVIGANAMLTRGTNVPNLSFAIFESFNGSDTDAVQKLGRMARLSVDRVAYNFILLPYYMKEVKDKNGTISYVLSKTQQFKWAQKMLANTVIESHELIDLR